MTQNPYATPNAAVIAPPDGSEKIAAVSGAQRMLLYGVLASLIGNVVMKTSMLVAALMIPVALGIAAFSIWCVYRLCKALEMSPVLWIIAMFIPLVNLICLVALNSKATGYLKQNGIAVGLLGAKR